MKKTIAILLLIYPLFVFCQQKGDISPTYFESSDFLETPTYKATVDYCKELVEKSKMVNMVSIGESARGKDIPMLIIDKDFNTNPNSIKKSGRLVVLIQACVHPGEPDGKDAGFMLIRDLIFKKKNIELLDDITILFIPIFNVDGHERWGAHNRINQNGPKEMGWRTTAANYNLNRDYLKADAIEMKHWLKMYNKWNPDFLFDCHTTDGADYQYAITYSLETSGNMNLEQSKWLENKYIQNIEPKMDSLGYPIFPYVIFKSWHDPRSGLINYVSPIKLMNGYAAARNRGCMLIETHMLKPYKTRVFATYELIMESLKIFKKEKYTLPFLNKRADDSMVSKEFFNTPFPITFAPSGDSIMTTFKGVHYDVDKSDLTGGNWFKYDNTRNENFSIPYYRALKVESQVTLPYAYAIPPEITFVSELLDIHKIEYFRTKADITIPGEITVFDKIELSANSSEGRQTIKSQINSMYKQDVMIPKGSIIVPVSQLRLKLVAHMFEPDSPDSFLQWGFFNIYFEQKEYAESYVMEKMMREMMEKDPALKLEFETKMKNDTLFRDNQYGIYNWFYKKTPYWDKVFNVYPVIRVPEQITLDLLMTVKKGVFR